MWMIAANFRRTHSPIRLAWSEGWRPSGAQSTFIRLTGWTLAMTLVMMTANINIVIAIIIIIIIKKCLYFFLLYILSSCIDICFFKPDTRFVLQDYRYIVFLWDLLFRFWDFASTCFPGYKKRMARWKWHIWSNDPLTRDYLSLSAWLLIEFSVMQDCCSGTLHENSELGILPCFSVFNAIFY